MSALSEYLPEFAITQLTYPAFTAGNGHISEVSLVLYHLVNALLEGVLSDETVDEDILMLANAVGSVGGLCLNRGIPPEIIVDDMTCSGEIEASACGFQGEQEHLVAACVLLETVHHCLTLLDAATAMKKQRSFAQSLFYHLLEHVAHFAELGKDKYLLTTFNDGFQQREKHFRLT